MKMRGSWKTRVCKSAVGSNGELGTGMGRLNISVMHSSKESLAIPLLENETGQGTSLSTATWLCVLVLATCWRVVCKWLQFWKPTSICRSLWASWPCPHCRVQIQPFCI